MNAPLTPQVTSVPDAELGRRERHVPGEPGVWVFLLGDMLIFAAIFGAYLVNRAQNVAAFDDGQRTLDRSFGATMTLLLLTSSLLVVVGVRAARSQAPGIARLSFAGGMACGAGFIALKLIEYGDKFAHGQTPSASPFFLYYFTLTGLHLFHLLLGMGALGALIVLARDPRANRRMVFLEGGACFWHLIDLLWIVLFPLLYLVR